MLTTAGGLVFAGDGDGNIVAHDAATGKPLWHARIGGVTNPAETFMLDGHQYLVVAAGDTVWLPLMWLQAIGPGVVCGWLLLGPQLLDRFRFRYRHGE